MQNQVLLAKKLYSVTSFTLTLSSCNNQLCHFPVDSADIWKHDHNLGNLVVDAGRGVSKKCKRPIHEHGMVCLATLTLPTVTADLADVLSLYPPEPICNTLLMVPSMILTTFLIWLLSGHHHLCCYYCRFFHCCCC
jgi:hypothetical protein